MTTIPITAAWFSPGGLIVIAALGGFAIGMGLRWAVNYFSLIRMVGVWSPISIMEVGGNDTVKAQLFQKPRFTVAQVVPVAGSITFYKDANTGVIYNLSNGGTQRTVTANMTATETLTGVQVGQEVMGVMGSDNAGNAFDAMGINVHVVDPQPDSITFYRLAIKLALEWWETGLLGNLRININSHPPGGLCDQWMDWAFDWLQNIDKGDVCKIEKCLSTDGGHNYLRVTMCDDTVYYLDPWIRPDDPVFGKDEYEDDYGLPSDIKDTWTKP
jgi:hypothetical protein